MRLSKRERQRDRDDRQSIGNYASNSYSSTKTDRQRERERQRDIGGSAKRDHSNYYYLLLTTYYHIAESEVFPPFLLLPLN